MITATTRKMELVVKMAADVAVASSMDKDSFFAVMVSGVTVMKVAE